MCNRTIVSIYINKPQFNKKDDFKKYPRTLDKDIYKLKKLALDYIYLPISKQIYPAGVKKNIKINSFKKTLCGKHRPGHFEAIVDVIDRFIKIIKPKKIFLGEKDMQQLLIIDDFVKKNHPYTKVISCKTVRERNGIACSSRNYLLSRKEKDIASMVYIFILSNKKKLLENKISIKNLKKILYNFGVDKIDYLEILNVNKVIKPYKRKNKFKIFIAYYLGATRLIDNV
jgi:pantoate--beta-alanine ligase